MSGELPDRLRKELLRRWAEPHRRYHDRRHLREVLAALPDDVPATVVLGAWYHDAVYDPTRDDNEAASARLAREHLDGLLPAPELAEVQRLVLLTRTHEVAPGDDFGAMLVDADLAVLAAVPDRYAEYAGDVRAEYAHLSDDDFRRGRTEVLRRLLAHQPLYATARGRLLWDATARANLRRELRALAGPSGDAAPHG